MDSVQNIWKIKGSSDEKFVDHPVSLGINPKLFQMNAHNGPSNKIQGEAWWSTHYPTDLLFFFFFFRYDVFS